MLRPQTEQLVCLVLVLAREDRKFLILAVKCGPAPLQSYAYGRWGERRQMILKFSYCNVSKQRWLSALDLAQRSTYSLHD